MRALGLNVHIDPAGNPHRRMERRRRGSVSCRITPRYRPGGRSTRRRARWWRQSTLYGGCSGVGFQRRGPCGLYAFMDEEGTRSTPPSSGVRAFTGQYMIGVSDGIDGDGISLQEAIAPLLGHDLGESTPPAGSTRCAYLELHVEQGPVLERRRADRCGERRIVGLRGYRVVLRGRANHAGTTPMTLPRRLIGHRTDRARVAGGFARNGTNSDSKCRPVSRSTPAERTWCLVSPSSRSTFVRRPSRPFVTQSDSSTASLSR